MHKVTFFKEDGFESHTWFMMLEGTIVLRPADEKAAKVVGVHTALHVAAHLTSLHASEDIEIFGWKLRVSKIEA
jgi:hypothetical protein